MDGESVELTSEFLSEFECPICAKYMMPPIGQCTHGHCFCSTCFAKIIRCALCRAPKSNYRCVTLEKIHSYLIFPCVYVDQGCNFQARGKCILDHQKHCKYSFTPCPLRTLNGCQWKSEKTELVPHCRREHEGNIFFNTKQKLMSSGFVDKEDRVYYIVFYVFNTLFRCTWDLDKTTGLIRFAVYCLDNQDMFSFEISFMSKDREIEIVSVRGPCYCMEDDGERFLENKYFTLHHDHLKELCDDDGDLNYIVNIFKTD